VRIAVVVAVIYAFPYWVKMFPWLASVGLPTIFLSLAAFFLFSLVIIQGGEYWLMNRWARRHKVSLEDIAYARYSLRWSFDRIMFSENFKEELTKEKQNLREE
jgi:hypothetical protein